MDTQTQIERLIELAIVQRTELKQLVEQLPQLREHLNAEIERNLEEIEPQLRSELEEFCDKRAVDANAKVGSALEAKMIELSKALEVTTQARFNAIKEQERKVEELRQLAAKQIEGHVAALPEAVKEIVGAELARFPRAGEIDQLRKEFAEPRGLNPRGKWLPSETYNKLDLVTWNGDSYVSNIDGNTEKPSRNSPVWTLSAARGIGGGGPSDLSALTAVPSNGSLLIGSGTSWVNGNIVAGAGINVTNGAGSITISATDGDITLDDGTAASPSLHFTNDADTGIYRPAANTLGISVSGTQVAYFDQNGLTVPSAGVVAGGSIHAANGNANNPSLSFSGDQDTGFFRHQPNELGIALGGTQYATLTSTTFSVTPALSVAGVSRVTNSTASSSTTTGALVVTGGVGIGGAANVGGNVTVSGTTGVTSTDVILGSSGPSVKSTLSARAPRQGLVWDGSGGANATLTLPAFGTGDFVIAAWIKPTLGGAANNYICFRSGGLGFYVSNTTGKLGTEGGVSYVGTNALTTNKWAFVAMVRSSGTDSFYVNGVLDGTIADTTDYSGAITAIGNSNAASIILPLIYNRALSSSEVVALYEAGAPAGADFNNATNTSIFSGAWTNYVGFGLGFTSTNGTNLTASSSTGLNYAIAAISYPVIKGHKYRFTCSATITSGTPGVGILDYTGGSLISNIPFLSAGSNVLEITATATDSAAKFYIRETSGTGTNFALTNISVTPLGLLLAPDAYQAGGGLSWYDTSGNSATITLPASGVSWNVPSSQKTASGWTFGGKLGVSTSNSVLATLQRTGFSGGIEVYADDTGPILYPTDATDSLRLNTAGSPTITLGADKNATLAGNLSVSGTGTFTRNEANSNAITTALDYVKLQNSNLGGKYTGAIEFYTWDGRRNAGIFAERNSVDGTSGVLSFAYSTSGNVLTEGFRLNANGNLLLGTTTDSSNGKLQLATHTTSAGGIGFGTATSQYTTAAGDVSLDAVSGNEILLRFRKSGTEQFRLESSSNQTYITAANNMYLRSSGVTALTLDSSQNATFAGTVTATGQVRGGTLRSDGTITMAGTNSRIIAGPTSWGVTNNAGTVDNLAITDAGNATFAGWVGIKDGSTAPSATSGTAKIYVDTADGDLKIIFGDGTVKTIATD